MKASEIPSIVAGTRVGPPSASSIQQDVQVTAGYTSDLMSDVMAHASAGSVLVTVQAHRNTVAVAGLVGVVAIVVCNGRPIPDDMLSAAADEGIPLIVTGLTPFEASGRLYDALR